MEDYIPQTVAFASPPKWHLAHTTWFFEQMVLQEYQKDYRVFDPEYSYLFNSYYNTVGKRVLQADRGNMTRPTVSEILAYREYVDDAVRLLLSSNPPEECKERITVGLHHEQQHQELLFTDLKYTLGHNPLFPVYDAHTTFEQTSQEQATEWKTVSEGVYEIGFDGEGFHFDNEKGRHKQYLEEYQIASNVVTNGEYLDFIESGGYTIWNLWLDEGWKWLQTEDVSSPLYWHKINGEWHYYTLSGLRKIDKSAALCHVSFYEANAYANFRGARLPTEGEWEAASDQVSWGTRWEWTNSAYLPYPRFEVPAGALGEYNGKFMINTMVLRGASDATSKGHERKTYRNFFHPKHQWQFSGIRLAKNKER